MTCKEGSEEDGRASPRRYIGRKAAAPLSVATLGRELIKFKVNMWPCLHVDPDLSSGSKKRVQNR